MQSSKGGTYLKVNAWRGWWQDLISECGQDLVYWIHKYYSGHIILQLSLIGLSFFCHILLQISYFKGLTHKNMTFTTICHLATFYLYVITKRLPNSLMCPVYVIFSYVLSMLSCAWPHSNIISWCSQFLNVFISRYETILLDSIPKVLLQSLL